MSVRAGFKQAGRARGDGARRGHRSGVRTGRNNPWFGAKWKPSRTHLRTYADLMATLRVEAEGDRRFGGVVWGGFFGQF